MFDVEKSVAFLHPWILNIWDDTEHNPYVITPYQNIKIKTKCLINPKHPSDYHTLRNLIVKKKNLCAYCNSKKACLDNCLATNHPEVLKDWNYEKNNPITPYNITKSSGKRVWWKCHLCNHETYLKINNKTSGKACAYCTKKIATEEYNLTTEYPTLLKYWDYEKNTTNPKELLPRSRKRCFWKCDICKEEWELSVNDFVTRIYKCLYCENKIAHKANNLFYLYPEITSQWISSIDSDKTPKELLPHSNIICEWKCTICKKTWLATPNDRVDGHGCPHCVDKETIVEKGLSEILGLPRFNQRIFTDRRFKPDIEIIPGKLYANGDGLKPHCKLWRPDRWYHYEMYHFFRSNNVRLLQFYQDEIRDKADIIRSIVNHLLNKNTSRVYARKLIINKEPKKGESNKFLKENHLIGPCTGSSFMSLEDENQNIFGILAYQEQENHINITRICFKKHHNIIGGLSKLIHALRIQTNFQTLRTMTDNRYADGHGFEKLGFVKIKEKLGYQYADLIKLIRKHKQSLRVVAGLNEQKEAAKKKCYRIYDSGKVTWELK